MFTPKHWHQTIVCYQAMRVHYSSKQINQRSGPIIYHMKLMTLIMVHRLKKPSITVPSSQKLSEMRSSEFLCYGIEIKNWRHFTT